MNNNTGSPLPNVPGSTESYASAFARLSQIAEKLKNSSTASLDTIVDEIREARAAHRACARRLAAVRAEIEKELASADDGADGTA